LAFLATFQGLFWQGFLPLMPKTKVIDTARRPAHSLTLHFLFFLLHSTLEVVLWLKKLIKVKLFIQNKSCWTIVITNIGKMLQQKKNYKQ